MTIILTKVNQMIIGIKQVFQIIYVTKCKIINLIINQIFLSFNEDIRAELYLKTYNFDYLPRRIDALLCNKAKGIYTHICLKKL